MSDFIYTILDIGSTRIRCGLAGQFLPSAIVDNKGFKEVGSFPPYLELKDHSLDDETSSQIRHQLQNTYSTLIERYSLDSVNWMNSGDQWDVALHRNFLELMSFIPLTHSRCRVIIIDEFPVMVKYVISRILLIKMGFKSVQFIPKPILSGISANCGNGLVVDLSWSKFKVTSLYEYRIIDEHEGFVGLSGVNLHYKVLEKLVSTGKNADFDEIEQFIMGKGQLDVDLDEIIDSLIGPVVTTIAKLIESSPIDLRAVFKSNLIFDGGVCKVKGVKSKLGNGIKCLGAWQGGSIYCSTSILKRTRSIRKTEEITKEMIKDMTDDQGIQFNKLF
ncbi:hypothetical protein CLIB1444_11S02894 [[Candida] jaroonii]|uniref:Uncharacterized protein n=1 Tax=[Candida] jaroonii TaxID=467808 RepID=A0ACA9YDP1_9ASCO|nr:hypothetical protein CLIB1444_11S02894 [[Candida] jaroonii]